ncbi:MAG TPA: hypothetical protein PKE39_00330 [Ignavibacteria bacterium]|nr:hypothetical protein [Ignavibacteria bacterium]HMQ97441.1 hypothetical protein [Ignavibacteria bacterium]
MKNRNLLNISLIFLLSLYLTGCFPASRTEEDSEQTTETTTEEKQNEVKDKEVTDVSDASGAKIMRIAASEQNVEWYSPGVDSTYLYWLNNQLIILNGSTKCNIFALNVLYKSGFKTPKQNALCRDLHNTDNFTDILPVVGIKDISSIKKGDLIVWKGHVIIFEEMVQSKKDIYVKAWWAGTRQKDNGDNIRNNVIYGKYKISGDYVVRRPMKK